MMDRHRKQVAAPPPFDNMRLCLRWMFIVLSGFTVIFIALTRAPATHRYVTVHRRPAAAAWRSHSGRIAPQNITQLCANASYINCPGHIEQRGPDRKILASAVSKQHAPPESTIPLASKTIMEHHVLRTERGYVPGSLELFDSVLYQRAINAIEHIAVVPRPGAPGVSHDKRKVVVKGGVKFKPPDPKPATGFLNVCSSEQTAEATLVLFTSMYHDENKQFIFTNILTNYALLGKKVIPILFITDKDIVTKSGYLIHRACELGWTVAAAPQRTQFGFPILPHMFKYAQELHKVQWYGYINADILLTPRLLDVIDHLNAHPDSTHISFLTSRRLNVFVGAGCVLQSLREADELFLATEGAFSTIFAIDYFIYRHDADILTRMPAFCAGRRGFDNWLIYHQVANDIPSLDMTEFSPGLHLGISGVPMKNISHQAKKQEGDYNMKLARGSRWVSRGNTNCLSHQLIVKTDSTFTQSIKDKLKKDKWRAKQDTSQVVTKTGQFDIIKRTKFMGVCRPRGRKRINVAHTRIRKKMKG